MLCKEISLISHKQIPIYRAVGSIKMDNGQLIIDNEGVAFGHDLNHFLKDCARRRVSERNRLKGGS